MSEIVSSKHESAADDEDDVLAVILLAARDYIEGFYTADCERMERALHPELAKRIFRNDGGSVRLDQMSALTLINRTRAGVGLADQVRRSDIRILDRFQNSATVRVDATNWVDYLHMAFVEGSWKIVNVLWEMREPS